MLSTISRMIRDLSASADGEVTKKYMAPPKLKPPRRKPSVENKSNRSDYMKNYMDDYRKEQGKDYQKIPDAVKKHRAEQRKRLKEKFNLKSV
jgi:hypothetical protein